MFLFKEHGGIYGTTGIPDLVCCVDGKFVAFEVKTKDGKTTILQQIAINKINKANGIAKVVRSVEEVKEIIKNIIRI